MQKEPIRNWVDNLLKGGFTERPFLKLVQRYGVYTVLHSLPKLPQSKMMEPKQCYKNAEAASRKWGYSYCQGFFLDTRIGIAIEHAWVLDGGKILELTLQPRNHEVHYFGFSVPWQTINAATASIGYNGLPDYLDNFAEAVQLITEQKTRNALVVIPEIPRKE